MSQLRKKFVVVGAGAVGVSCALMLKRGLEQKIQENKNSQTTKYSITLVDPNDFAGAGTTYWDYDCGQDSNVYLNNQPNERMIVDLQQRDAYTNFLIKNGHTQQTDPKLVAKSFSSRATFGRFVNNQLWETIKNSRNSSVEINIKNATAKNLIQTDTEKLELILDNDKIEADIVLNASGHRPNHLFGKFNDVSGFFNSPACIKSLHEHINSATNKAVAILGSGQSMIDAFAALDRNQALQYYTNPGQPQPECFSREVHVLSRSPSYHWPFIPENNPTELDDTPFEPKILTAANIVREQAYTLKKLATLLEKEVKTATNYPIEIDGQSFSFGPGHIYAKLNMSSVENLFDTEEKQKALNDFKQHVRALFSNPTPLERYRMLKDTNYTLHLGSIMPDDITQQKDGSFILQTKNGDNIHVGTIINATAFARNAFTNPEEPETVRDPFLRRLHEKSYLSINPTSKGLFAAGHQKISGLFLAHNAATHESWGMEKFSNENQTLITQLVRDYA
ncbi:MAG: FAD/NAD(P)-binding protein [Alphaproteobacteria bacterium]